MSSQQTPQSGDDGFIPVRLHGGWQLTGSDSEPGHFSIWGETEFTTVPEVVDSSGIRVPQHPSQVSLEYLANVLTAMGLPGLTGRGADLPASKVVIDLPVVDGVPVPAIERPIFSDGRKWPRRTAPWTVQVLQVDTPSIIEVLGALTVTLPQEVQLGPDMEYWSRACRQVLHLLARQRFAPIVERRDRRTFARWVPIMDDPKDAERIRALAESIPEGCLSFSSQKSAHDLIDNFMRRALDACIRRWLEASPEETSRLQKEGLQLSAWWDALQRDDAEVKISPAQGEQLELAIAAWMRPLSWARTSTPVRTCLRLEEPIPQKAIEREGAWIPEPHDRCWHLSYLLQPSDDPSLLVDAEDIWEGTEDPGVALLKQRMERPHEQLLLDLSRVARLSPPVESSLRRRAPSGTHLTTSEAFSFLTDVSPLLEESGVGVMVPTWWKNPESRLGVRVRVKRGMDGIEGPGHFRAGRLAVFDWQLSLGDTVLSEDEFTALSETKGGLVYLHGMWVQVDPNKLVATARRWKKKGNEVNLLDILRWEEGLDSDSEGLPITGVDAETDVENLLERLKQEKAVTPITTPTGFNGELRPYQERGVAWLDFLRSFDLGMCLADDMGLGKTIQVLALFQHLSQHGQQPGPSLLLCPTSVIGNWAKEAQRFTPDLQVQVHHGTDRLRGKALLKVAKKVDLLVTSYALLVRDHEDLVKIKWDGLLLDEAQAIKNPGTKQTKACRKIDARWRIALTGTPVENRLRDLWSLFSVINPDYLGNLGEFTERFSIPIESEGDPGATARLKGLIRPFLLRRLKTDSTIISDLPPKIESKDFCALTREQASLYQALVDRMVAELDGADEEVAMAKTRGLAAQNRARFKRSSIVLNTLLRLKQVCNHPALTLGDDSPLHGRSGKLKRLVELLEEMTGAGESALVFTQFASFAKRLQPYLAERLGVEVLLLHGGTSRPAREGLIAKFQDPSGGPRVFLLSIKAGGLGLNLTAANHVIHFDRWWNPAVEEQATDRAYRIGQMMTVHVHKLVTRGTVEDAIDELLTMKKDLAESIVGAGEDWLTGLSTQKLRQIVRLQHTVVEE